MKAASWEKFLAGYQMWHALYEVQTMIAEVVLEFDKDVYARAFDFHQVCVMRARGGTRKEISDYLKDRKDLSRST